MVGVYSKVGVYRSVHISTRGFVSAQYKCTEFLDPGNMQHLEWQLIITLEWQLLIIIKIVDTGSGLDFN